MISNVYKAQLYAWQSGNRGGGWAHVLRKAQIEIDDCTVPSSEAVDIPDTIVLSLIAWLPVSMEIIPFSRFLHENKRKRFPAGEQK